MLFMRVKWGITPTKKMAHLRMETRTCQKVTRRCRLEIVLKTVWPWLNTRMKLDTRRSLGRAYTILALPRRKERRSIGTLALKPSLCNDTHFLVSSVRIFVSFLFFSQSISFLSWIQLKYFVGTVGAILREILPLVFRLIRSYKPLLVCLVETSANFDRLDRFSSKIPRNWEWVAIEANGFSGSVFVFLRSKPFLVCHYYFSQSFAFSSF